MGDENTQEMTPIEKLHDLRKRIDANIQYVSFLKGDSREDYKKFGREISLVYTKLQEAKMWAGKCLEQIDQPLPQEFADKAE